MDVSEENIRQALRLALSEHWEDGLPKVNAKMRLAVNSLKHQLHGSLPSEAKQLTKLIKQPKNRKVKQIIAQHTIETFAFAIRDSLR